MPALLHSLGVGSPVLPVVVAYSALHLDGHLTNWRVEHVCDPPQLAHGRVDDPAFYAADLGPIKAAIGAYVFPGNGPHAHGIRARQRQSLSGEDRSSGSAFAPLHRQIRW
jgi:hypothetical protein